MTFDPRWGQAELLQGDTLAPGITISSLESVGVLDELHVDGPGSFGAQAPTVNVALRAEDPITGANGVAVKFAMGGAVTVAANSEIVAGALINNTISINAGAFTGVEYRGQWIRNPAVSAGTLATSYGLYVDAMTAGTTDYAIYTNAGTVRFGDVVNIASANGLQVSGTKVVGAQGAAVADASGGATIDTQARTALNALLARLRTHGLIAT